MNVGQLIGIRIAGIRWHSQSRVNQGFNPDSMQTSLTNGMFKLSHAPHVFCIDQRKYSQPGSSLFSLFTNRRRKRILSQRLSDVSIETIARNVWQYRSLNEKQQVRVQQCAQVMAAEKSWEGIFDFEVTDEVKLTISATAGLLTLGLTKPYYFDRVKTIIVYPGPIKNQRLNRGFLVSHEDAYYSGLAWQGGPLVFSWPNSLRGAKLKGDGVNVVIHEFIHHIDGLDGEMGGSPIIESEELRTRWKAVFDRRFRELVEDLDSNRNPLIDEYAATSLAEFFAVAGENFFDSPERLQQDMPDVYELLKDYFDVDPIGFES